MHFSQTADDKIFFRFSNCRQQLTFKGPFFLGKMVL